MTDHDNSMARLLQLRSVLGPPYGSEHLSMLLYVLVRRERPSTVVELGTGLGVSTFWIAQALKENGEGRLWTIDDGSQFKDASPEKVLAPLLTSDLFRELKGAMSSFGEYFDTMAQLIGVKPYVTLLQQNVDLSKLADAGIGGFPFDGKKIDFLFSDFRHGPEDVLNLLAAFLPNLADSASIFVDSASTHISSYLVLDRLMDQLRRNKIPRNFLTTSPRRVGELAQLVFARTFSVTHLVERSSREQNSTAWIKVEPNDYVPYPLARNPAG